MAKHVLYVEDNDVKYRAAARFLGMEGLQVMRAKTYSEAHHHLVLHRSEVQFILTDWSFPIGDEMDIATACAGKEMVELAKSLGIPSAVYSGHDRPRDYEGIWVSTGERGLPRRLRDLATWIKEAA